jgi:hypothetical protein
VGPDQVEEARLQPADPEPDTQQAPQAGSEVINVNGVGGGSGGVVEGSGSVLYLYSDNILLKRMRLEDFLDSCEAGIDVDFSCFEWCECVCC